MVRAAMLAAVVMAAGNLWACQRIDCQGTSPVEAPKPCSSSGKDCQDAPGKLEPIPDPISVACSKPSCKQDAPGKLEPIPDPISVACSKPSCRQDVDAVVEAPKPCSRPGCKQDAPGKLEPIPDPISIGA